MYLSGQPEPFQGFIYLFIIVADRSILLLKSPVPSAVSYAKAGGERWGKRGRSSRWEPSRGISGGQGAPQTCPQRICPPGDPTGCLQGTESAPVRVRPHPWGRGWDATSREFGGMLEP